MTTSLNKVGNKPNHKNCESAFLILRSAHNASNSFLDIFSTVRKNRNARGAPTDDEQDLLRAMLTFAGSGLDSMVKQLVDDALPSVIKRDSGAQGMLKKYIERKLKRGDEIDHHLLADILGEANPRERLINKLVNELTSKSLQSTDQLLRVGSFFNIPSDEICNDRKYLSAIFMARNEIAHEMDIDFNQYNRNRRPRARSTMIEFTNFLFKVSYAFLEGVDKKLRRRIIRRRRISI